VNHHPWQVARTIRTALPAHRLKPQLRTEDASFHLPLRSLVEISLACVLPSAPIVHLEDYFELCNQRHRSGVSLSKASGQRVITVATGQADAAMEGLAIEKGAMLEG
jgi:hypothetical protein